MKASDSAVGQGSPQGDSPSETSTLERLPLPPRSVPACSSALGIGVQPLGEYLPMAEMSWARLPEAMSTVRWVSSQASAGIGSVFTVAPSTRMPTFASVGSESTSEVSDLRAASIVGVPAPSSEAIEPEASRTTASSSPCRSCTAAPRRGCCATTARCRRPGCCRPSANCSRPSTSFTRQGSSTATEARRHPAAPGLRAGHRPLGLRHGGAHRGAPARAGDPSSCPWSPAAKKRSPGSRG